MGQFDALSDIDFEDFVADLLSAKTGLRFNAGTRGRDGGIDALSVVDSERHVIQCKHFIRSDFNALRRQAREAAEELKQNEPGFSSYWFVSSLEMSHIERDALVKILEPWVGSRDHVLGGKELIAYLGEYPAVATHHPKLWFQGAWQLRRQLSAEQYERRNALLEEIKPRLPRYVKTGAFESARRCLQGDGVCIIDGPPGIGKTTLAQLLLTDGMENGFEPFELVRGRIGKAWDLLDLDERQIFYFDDFLGRTALHEARDDDDDLAQLLRRIAKDERRRVVLTTRDYIFTEARRRSDALYEIDESQLVVLTPERYTRAERARILYNHLHFSTQVGAREKSSLVASGRYLTVIDHELFTPRKIEWITGFSGRLRREDKANYGLFCVQAMSSADSPWADSFAQLDQHQQALLLGFLGLPSRVSIDDLEMAFEATCAARDLPYEQGEFERSLAGLENDFVEAHRSGRWYSLLDPSLLDFLERQVVTSRADTEAALRSAYFHEQVRWLWDAWSKGTDLPPEHLWPCFDLAFSRVFDRVEESWIESIYGTDDTEASRVQRSWGKRLEVALERCQHPWFKEKFAAWLPTYAQQWADGVGNDMLISKDEVELLGHLLDAGLLEADAGEEIKWRIRSLDPSIWRWQLLSALRNLPADSLSQEEVAEEESLLRDYIEWVLEEPIHFYEEEGFYGTEGLDQLLELAAAWGLAPDEAELDHARGELMALQGETDKAVEREESWHQEELGPVPASDPEDGLGDGDELEAIFSRFLRDSGRQADFHP